MTAVTPIAIVGVSAIMPDAPDAETFWANIRGGRYSISDVPTERWDPELYYDPDPRVPDKTYSRIGGWVRDYPWDPIGWRLPVPPTVADQMEAGQKWAVAGARTALLDAGWPEWPVDPERVAVIIGNAIGGDKQYRSSLRVEYPEFDRELRRAPSFAALPASVRDAVLAETRTSFLSQFMEITEDSMPGELANVTAGRIANLFNLRGANFTTDAACASGLAAMSAAVHGLRAGDFDAVITGGVDRNMHAAAFVKFCKIGALSATGTRPFDAGADGFVMGEGAALFVLKRLADAERDGDHIYAVLLGIGGSSDGRGKGITAPNPTGQRLAIERAWQIAGVDPALASYVEAHGTSTRVGDATELASLSDVFGKAGAQTGAIALGSVKSNIGHLKAAAGAAGLFKVVLSLHEKVLAPSLHVTELNPNVDWDAVPFRVNTELRDWSVPTGGVRLAGVSAFGFGGTNFHVVIEEYVPGRHRAPQAARSYPGVSLPQLTTAGQQPAQAGTAGQQPAHAGTAIERPAPIRGAVVVGGRDDAQVAGELARLRASAAQGQTPPTGAPDPALAAAAVRVAIDYADAADLAAKATKAIEAIERANPAQWRLLRAQGIFVGRGAPGKVAFLYPGQGSQYLNMLADLRASQPVVARTFDEADRLMTPLLGGPLTACVFADTTDPQVVARLDKQLMQTEITQPAVLTADLALTRLLDSYGIQPDMVMGHSLGEYGALVAAGALSFDSALEAVSARGHEMASLSMADNGAMAAVFGPLDQIERIVAAVDGYVVIANINSTRQAVVGGATDAVERAMAAFESAGLTATRIPVSHAFHTSIVAPASKPLTAALRRLALRPPALPVVANVTGEFYPGDADVETMLDLLGRQVASPVQFVKGLHTLYAAGARVFVEVGPKKALYGFVEDVLGDDAVALFTNHPKSGDLVSFNQALCGLYAAGLGFGRPQPVAAPPPATAGTEPVVITGAALGLPGVERVFDDANIARILDGEQFIDTVPHRLRQAMVDHSITRLVKRESGDPTFETIDSEADVVKLAGRRGALDLVAEFGIDPARDATLDVTTRLAIGAGIDALRDAGIPLVMQYKTTTLGTKLADRWGLPASMRDDTGVIFASAFPGYDSFAHELEGYFSSRGRRDQLAALESVRARMDADNPARTELDRRIHALRHAAEADPYTFDRRFLFRCLSMGHSQFAELIGARGPNTQINAACASTTLATALAEDWIRAGRCRRVVVVSGDDATSNSMLPWIGSGFLASGAAATDDIVEDAATPFDRRRHGLIVGMGAAAFVVESAAAARERGLQPICEILGTVTANSAYHGTRLDVEHIGEVMQRLLVQAEARGIDRKAIAPATVFVSHETYTPARGGSASAEISALRRVFGAEADAIVITNTKGFTGHAMGAGVEEIVAIKALETGVVPPVPNVKEPDPELGPLNLSTGGTYPVRYALRLAAGFGSQIAMSLLRWTPPPDGQHRAPDELGYGYRIADPAAWHRWLAGIGGADAQLEVVQRRLRVADKGVAPAGARPAVAAQAPQVVAAAPRAVAAPQPVVVPPPEPVTMPEPVAVVAPEPVAVAAPEPVAVAAAAPDSVTETVVGIVSGLTGYPADLLDLDLDLEADLGVDTVKQAEVFAAVREHFHIARDDTLPLRNFPTLTHVIGWIRDKTTTAPQTAAATPTPASQPPAIKAPVAQPTVTEAPPTPIPAATPAPTTPADDVPAVVVGIVSGLTGYPADLLDLDLDLEADLGVDTVKQAEVFAAVREHFHIARDDTLPLRNFPTLTHVIGWIRDKTTTPTPTPATQPPAIEAPGSPAPPATSQPVAAPLAGDLAATDHIVRRVPVPVLRPDLAVCVPTGVTLGVGTRVVVVRDRGGVGDALVSHLKRLGAEVLAAEPEVTAAELDAFAASAAVHGVYWLAALDDEGPLADLNPAGWRDALHRRVYGLYATMRHLYDQSPFLVTATRLGGYHGYDDAGATCPLGGAVTGFAKAYRRERPDATVKAVDFAASGKTAALAELLVAETLRDPGCVEIGYAGGRRWGVGLAQRPFPTLTQSLAGDQVYLVTGAAGSIVSAITADLAAASGGTFHLLDLTPQPDPGDPDLCRYVEDQAAYQVEFANRMRARGERPTPVLIGHELARLERSQAALAAIQAVERAGGTVHYHCVDLTDPNAVEKVMAQVRDASGRVDVLLHAAGIEISHALPDKDPDEFDRVLRVKADGLFHLLHAAADLPLGTVVGFSSVAGRFGNTGQTDYSAANDLMCTVLSSLRRSRPQVRALAIDWTAWAGIGMATRGSIPKLMELAGVEMLPAAAGIAWVRRELMSATGSGEVVVAGALGSMAGEFHDTGGVDPAALTGHGPMAAAVQRVSVHTGLTVRTMLDPARQPFLDHHRINGVAVLPGVMTMEAFAEAAMVLAPGWHLAGLENVDFLAPLKFYRDEPRALSVTALVRPDGADLVAECRLVAERTVPGTQSPQPTLHATGSVRLTAQPPTLPAQPYPVNPDGKLLGPDEVYRLFFHGPAYQVVGSAWRHDDGAAAALRRDLPPGTDAPTLIGPRLIELCFQTAGLWEAGHEGRLALPLHVDAVRLGADPSERPELVATAQPAPAGGFTCAVRDGSGAVVVEVEGYRTVALPDPLSDEVMAPIGAILRG